MNKSIVSVIVITCVLCVLVLLGVYNSGDDAADTNNVTDAENVDNDDTSSPTETEETTDLVMEEITGVELNELVNGKDKVIIYVMQTGCSYCTDFTPILNKVAKANDIEIKYINLANMNDVEDQNGFYESHDYLASGIGTPTTAIAQNGGIFGIITGYVDEASVIKFFTDHGYID